MISAGSLRDVRVPGKVFLMGEYSVIQGGKALVTAIRPGIEYSLDHGQALSVHPESPLGVFQSEQNSILEIKLSSSESSLGLGSSTAELIAAEVFSNGSTEGARSTKALWNWYRNHFPRASGATLLFNTKPFEVVPGFLKWRIWKRFILSLAVHCCLNSTFFRLRNHKSYRLM